MTDDARSPLGPPWSVDVLADLHAGVLDAEQSARLWPAVNADPEARAVLAALDTVKVGLGRLGAAPVEPMPAQFAARLDAALAAEAARTRAAAPPESPAAVTDLAQARQRRNRRLGWAAGVLTAAAAAVAVTVTLFPPADQTGGNPVAAGPGQNNSDAAKPPLPVDRSDLSAALGGVSDERDYGPLKDQAGLDRCLVANKIDPATTQTLGVRQVTLRPEAGQQTGKPGIFVLLSTGELGRLRVLIVEPTCNADNPGTLVNTQLPSR